MAGTTDLTKLQEDVVLQSKSIKGHLNVTMNEVDDENFAKPDMSATDKFPEKVVDQENQPPLDKSVEQAADDTKKIRYFPGIQSMHKKVTTLPPMEKQAVPHPYSEQMMETKMPR